MTKKHPKYTFIKDNVYYFSKAVPSDLQHHYCKPRVVISLKTKSSHRAATASRIILSKLEEYWLGLRLKDIEVPAAHLLRSQATINLNSNLICLSGATNESPRATYLQITQRHMISILFTLHWVNIPF